MPQSSRVIVTLRACCSQRCSSLLCAGDAGVRIANPQTRARTRTSFFIKQPPVDSASIINNKTGSLASCQSHHVVSVGGLFFATMTSLYVKYAVAERHFTQSLEGGSKTNCGARFVR